MKRSYKLGVMKKIVLKYLNTLLWTALFSGVAGGAFAAATGDLSDVSGNIEESVSRLPGLLTGVAYMLAIMFGVFGILKLKDHVENPNQTPLRESMIRFAAGGALLALPIIYEAMRETIGTDDLDVESDSLGGLLAGVAGGIAALGAPFLQDINLILRNIIDSLQDVPGMVTGLAYMLGILLGVTGIIKLKEHVDSPQNVGLREGVIRLLIGGALFSIPTVYNAMFRTIEGDGSGFTGFVSSLLTVGGLILPSEALAEGESCITSIAFFGAGLGSVMCSLFVHTIAIPQFLVLVSYLFALVLGLWGILKLKDHVINPQQTTVWEGVTRLLAAGALFALPVIIEVAYSTLANGGIPLLPHTNTSFNDDNVSAGGLDAVMAGFMQDIFAPMNTLLNWFGMITGIILLIIAVTRLIKSVQEGPRGPGGLGTMITFLVGGALLSFSPMVTAFTSSFFSSLGGNTSTFATLQYTTGMGAAETDHAHAVISAVLRFMIVLGLVSFLRGLFIVRAVAEGNSQASMMAGITHLIGGALAVNLGPLMNAVQVTLGLTAYGVNFG